MTTKILALCGRKQSGKNTCFNFLLSLWMAQSAIVRTQCGVNDKGRLWVGDIFGDKDHAGVFDVDRNTPAMKNFRDEFIYPFIKNYSFADCLKQDVCINLLGLTRDQCYGTDEDKNGKTHLMWEDMPGVFIVNRSDNEEYRNEELKEIKGRLGVYYEKGSLSDLVFHESGKMTAREVMQFVGTEIFRKMYHNVWAQGTINRIVAEAPTHFAVITDCRFPNEVDVVKKAGGKVVRLTRNSDDDDAHPSETALDKDNYDWDNFDAIIDNASMSISECNEALHNNLVQWEWLGPIAQPSLTE